MPAVQKRRPARPGRAAPSHGRPKRSPQEPNEVGLVGKGGARERAQFSPEAKTERRGLCDDVGTAAKKGDAGAQAAGQRGGAPGRPRVYETPEELLEAVEAYFGGISRTVDVTEMVDTGERDSDGHKVFEPKVVLNDDGEVIQVTEFLVPPSITDLCLELGITKQTWVNYRNREGYRQIAEWAKTRVESYLRRESLTRTKGLQGVIFNLEQNFKDEEKKGNRPVDGLDLSAMTDEELLALAEAAEP